MIKSIEELSIIIEGLRLRVKQLQGSVKIINENIENLETADASKAPAIIQTTSPAGIASFSDGGEDMPIKSLKCTIIPVQAGTGDPAPDNIRPITGWNGVTVTRTGKNMFDPDSTQHEWVNSNTNEIITINAAKSVRIKVEVGKVYTLSNANDSSASNILLISYLNASGAVISRNVVTTGAKSLSVTAPANAVELIASFYKWSEVSSAQLEENASATDYEPYEGDSQSMSFPSTVYGGWIDVIKGELHVTKAAVDLGGMTWTKGTDSTGIYFYTTISNAKTQPSYVAPANIMCSQYVTCLASNVVDKGIAISVASPICFVRDTTYSDAAVFKEAMSGVQLVYELATEQVLPVEPVTITTLLGNNNVFCNTGNVEVEYAADTKIYIDNAVAAVTPEPEPTPEPEQDEAPQEEEEEAEPAPEEEIAVPDPEEESEEAEPAPEEESEEAEEEPAPVLKKSTRKK